MSVIAACALAPLASVPAIAVSSDAQVQMLANFPALQRLAAKGNAKELRRYLAQVAAAYRAAGYDAIAAALPKADDVIALFDDTKGTTRDREIRQARTALRHLQTALARNQKIALPSNSGERLPNYYGLASVFFENADRALKNIARGKSVANFLRKAPDTSWVTNIAPDTFLIGGTLEVTVTSSSGITKTGAGTLTLSGGNTGSTSINSGTLSLIGGGVISVGNVGNVTLNFGTSLNLGEVAGYRWVAFPPDIAIPDDWSSFMKFTLSSDASIGTDTFASGTRVVKAPEDLPLPDGAVELPAGSSLQVVGTFSYSGTFSITTPTPSPTPAE